MPFSLSNNPTPSSPAQPARRTVHRNGCQSTTSPTVPLTSSLDNDATDTAEKTPPDRAAPAPGSRFSPAPSQQPPPKPISRRGGNRRANCNDRRGIGAVWQARRRNSVLSAVGQRVARRCRSKRRWKTTQRTTTCRKNQTASKCGRSRSREKTVDVIVLRLPRRLQRQQENYCSPPR